MADSVDSVTMVDSCIKYAMELLKNNEELKIIVTDIYNQSLWGFGGSVVGGVVGGRNGALVGGIVGAALGYYITDAYIPFLFALNALSYQQRQGLVADIQSLIGSVALQVLLSYVACNAKPFVERVHGYLTKNVVL